MKYPLLLERFKQYVQIDTQSDPHSSSVPSTKKQKNLGELLVSQLVEMGVVDAHMDSKGYIYATVPATPAMSLPQQFVSVHIWIRLQNTQGQV